MKPQEKALLSSLLARSVRGEELIRYLPEQIASALDPLSQKQGQDLSKLVSMRNWSETIHFSWFCEPLKTLPKETHNLFLSLLLPEQVEQV